MGRSTLFLVLATVFGGSFLALTVLRTQSDTQGRRSDAQASVLARQLAESGQAIALSAITELDGFENDGTFTSSRDYNGGSINFESYAETAIADNGERVSIQVAGAYGGATHRLASVYEFDPMDFPGPLWIDVPYATGSIHSATTVSGGGFGYEPQLDPAKYDEFINGQFPGMTMDGLKSSLATAGAPVGDWNATGKARMDDLGDGIGSADDLYFQTRGAYDAATGDVQIVGDRTVSGTETWGRPDGVTWVQGDLSVPGTLDGDGALIVEGDLLVNGTMDWNGIVIVRSEEDHVSIELNGDVTLAGALVVSQEAFPPGGHMDISIYRQPDGNWTTPYGTYLGGPGTLRARPAPWGIVDPWPFWNHVHKFDYPAVGAADYTARTNKIIRFVDDDAGDPQEVYVGLRELLDHLGSQDVQIEFANVDTGSGQSVIEVEIDGESIRRGVSMGFADTDLAGPQKYRSMVFPARDLDRLVIHPQSLRSLRQLWDDAGTPSCAAVLPQWPLCVGADRTNREDALTVRIREPGGGDILYESAIYWHLQDGPEFTQYQADVAAWQAAVTSGAAPFGTDLVTGPQVDITYDLAPIAALTDKLGFDGNQITHISTESVIENTNAFMQGSSAAGASAGSPATGSGGPGGGTATGTGAGTGGTAGGTGSGGSGGTAGGTGSGTGSGGTGSGGTTTTMVIGGVTVTATPSQPLPTGNPNEWIWICHPPYGADPNWRTEEVKYSQFETWLGLGDDVRLGTCAENGK